MRSRMQVTICWSIQSCQDRTDRRLHRHSRGLAGCTLTLAAEKAITAEPGSSDHSRRPGTTAGVPRDVQPTSPGTKASIDKA